MNTLGQNLRRIRTKKGLTQAKLAELADINRRYYQEIEACRKNPTVVVTARLRKALKADWLDVLKGV
ncbi:MAG: helix-turn-helix domain-containing protein [Terrimicrobiaceae bacterium]